MQSWKRILTRRLLVAAIAVLSVASFATYEFTNSARAASAAPAAAPLDDNSVGALLTLDRAMETLAARVTPAVVNVTVTSKPNGQQGGDDSSQDMQQFFGPNGPFGGAPFGRQFNMPRMPRERIEHGLGSGVLISPDGYIVTNNHVVDGATDIRVTMSNRQVLPAKVVGTDPLTDLAVIKVSGNNLPSVPWGDSAKLHPGQTVLAFGNPYGFRFTVTRGIVSALNRPNPDPSDRRKPGEFIQTDAAINPGNSGGALVDARGELIGINTFLISSNGSFSGMGFAIPTQIVQPTVEALIRDGKISHGYIGIGISDVTPDNAHFFQMNNATGTLVTQVDPNSPGGKAGLRTGDVIVKLNNQTVTDAGELQMEVGQKRPGDTIQLEVVRDGKNMTIPVALEAMGPSSNGGTASSEHGKGRWGISLGDLNQAERDQMQIPSDVHGAVVEDVQPGSPADNAGLQRGDVIAEVNRHSEQSAADVAHALANIDKGQDALVLVWSNGGSTFRVLHPSQE
ncbi:MAG TPA: Do family serine endopeptidase [Candidatus Acidoferrum sp.]|jgi:serine protease Do|nr:Do family serine endopeptidase [Candidatus Acidoferrum sp.]